jgi:hypothetical protein
MNAGLRVEVSRLPSAPGRVASGFDQASINSDVLAGDQICATTHFSNPTYSCTSYVNTLKTALPDDFTHVFGAGGHWRSGRAGLAWDPFGEGTTAVRIGVGIYSGTFPFDLIDEARSTYPQFLPINWGQPSLASTAWRVDNLNTLTTLSAPFSNPFIFLVADGFGLVPVKIGSLGNSYSAQLSFAVEHRFDSKTAVNAAYVGTLGRDLLRASTPSGGAGFSVAKLTNVTNSLFPFAQYLYFPENSLQRTGVFSTVFDDGASSTYHSLQLQLTRHQAHGLELRASFVWSHAIDNASDYYGSAGTPAVPQSSVAPSERGDSNFDIRRRFTGYAIWVPPFFPTNRYFGGWQVVATGVAQSGLPYTITSANDINGDGNLTDRLNQTTNLTFRPYSGNPRIQALINTSDLSSFFAPYVANQNLDGRVGRNTFRSLGLLNLDLAVIKRGSIQHFGSFEFRVEAFNALNHVNFAIPIHVLEAPGFGTSVSTATSSRTLQIGLKKAF